MTYTEAVEKARKGDAEGFDFLYNATKNNKYYLALRYVKNEEGAKDVLQDAYIRAWKNLDKLKDPEKFDSWLAQIVVNTAKNELVKRNHTPLDLRAEAGDEEEDTEIFDRAVSSWENVPELEYTKEETRQLVHELIDSLSDEQRLVVIAFELEGMTTKEIAEQLGCSEATVKSRLRYGRNNIKEKAEELQKKGFKLYNLAPIAFLLYLFKKDMVAQAAEPSTQLALSECESKLLQSIKPSGPVPDAAGKAAFLSTKAGKTVIGIALTVTVAGAAIAGIKNSNADAPAGTVTREEQSTDELQTFNEEAQLGQSPIDALVESTEPEEIVLHDEVGWSQAYSMILEHIPDNTLNTVSEVGLYGFEKEVYDNLTEQGEQFEYVLVDLDKDDIPEMLVRANTSQTTYDGMSYWIMITYHISILDDQYREMPVMIQRGRYPIVEGVASAGGSRVFVTMNEAMDEFFIVSKSAANGDAYTYIGYMEYSNGLYYWHEEEVGYYTYEEMDALEEAQKAYPVEVQWHSFDTPFSW